MKLAAIYNCWSDGLDLLPYSVDNILPVVDEVIIVWSHHSNRGEYKEFIYDPTSPKVKMVQWEPVKSLTIHENETTKRNVGIDKARDSKCTHFLIMDSDEFYIQEEVEKEKEKFEGNKINGLVCRTKVLFKKPTLMVNDHTLVPFIQRLANFSAVGSFRDYPFAYDWAGNAHIDPTRRPNHTSGIKLSDIYMWHASWVRSDYNLKIENSAARNNLKVSSIYRDLENAKEGHYNEFYRSHLVTCDNIFNIPEL